MPRLTLTLVLDGMDIDDLDVLERLAELAPNMHWGQVNGEVHADLYTDEPPVRAVQKAIEAVRTVVPSARAIEVIDDLVAIPDVARRCGVSRETARLWAKEHSFPRPRGIVGSGIKVWDWGSVNRWLRTEHAGRLGDDYHRPTRAEVAEINALLRGAEAALAG